MNINNMKTSKPGIDKIHIIKMNPKIKRVRNVPSTALNEKTTEGYVSARRKVSPEERITKK